MLKIDDWDIYQGVSDRNGPHSADIPETGRGQFCVFWENRSFSETTRWIPLKNEILLIPVVIEIMLIFTTDRVARNRAVGQGCPDLIVVTNLQINQHQKLRWFSCKQTPRTGLITLKNQPDLNKSWNR